MICKNCGSEISDNNKFCNFCGKEAQLIKVEISDEKTADQIKEASMEDVQLEDQDLGSEGQADTDHIIVTNDDEVLKIDDADTNGFKEEFEMEVDETSYSKIKDKLHKNKKKVKEKICNVENKKIAKEALNFVKEAFKNPTKLADENYDRGIMIPIKIILIKNIIVSLFIGLKIHINEIVMATDRLGIVELIISRPFMYVLKFLLFMIIFDAIFFIVTNVVGSFFGGKVSLKDWIIELGYSCVVPWSALVTISIIVFLGISHNLLIALAIGTLMFSTVIFSKVFEKTYDIQETKGLYMMGGLFVIAIIIIEILLNAIDFSILQVMFL